MLSITAKKMKGSPFKYQITMTEDGKEVRKYTTLYKPVLSNGSITFETTISSVSLSAAEIKIIKEAEE